MYSIKTSIASNSTFLLVLLSTLSWLFKIQSFSFLPNSNSNSIHNHQTEQMKRIIISPIQSLDTNNNYNQLKATCSRGSVQLTGTFDHSADLNMPPMIRDNIKKENLVIDDENSFIDVENNNNIHSLREFCICNSKTKDGENYSEEERQVELDEQSQEEYLHPELITINAFDLLIKPIDEIGIYLREALLKAFDYSVRLPNPETFTKAFEDAYKYSKKDSQTFGATEGISSEEWWAPVIYRTYLSMGFPKEDMDDVFVDIFDELQNEVLISPTTWELTYDAIPVLEKLYEWRMRGNGPKLGVIVNFDERLETLMENMNIAHYFDLIISARECASAMPQRQIFDIALAKAGVNSARRAIHIGTEMKNDIIGANRAGWKAVHVTPPPWKGVNASEVPPLYDEATGNPVDIKYARVGDLHGVLRWYGIDDPDRMVETTFRMKNRPDDLKTAY